MVDVSAKPVTARSARASCTVRVSERLLRLLRDHALPKGDVRAVAEVAGVLGAKRAASLIPLCHPLALDAVRVEVSLGPRAVRVACWVRTAGRTGAEMEALAGAAVAALTVYDMCKAVDRDMAITDLRLDHKEGGTSSVRAGTSPGDPAPSGTSPGDPAPSGTSPGEADCSPLRPSEP